MIIVDLDDFFPEAASIETLLAIKTVVPKFCVTLFTIPGLCTPAFLEHWRAMDWVDMAPHGMYHGSNRECEHWDYTNTIRYLDKIEGLHLTHGFKAPGWQISDGIYQALLERGYWVADQAYNNHRRPPGLSYYLLDSGDKIHGHLGHYGGHNANELQLIMPEILKHSTEEFGFVKDNLVYG